MLNTAAACTHTRHTKHTPLPTPSIFRIPSPYKELSDSPSIPYPVTGKYSILREVHRQNSTVTLYQSLLLLLIFTDVSVRPGRCFTAPSTTCHTCHITTISVVCIRNNQQTLLLSKILISVRSTTLYSTTHSLDYTAFVSHLHPFRHSLICCHYISYIHTVVRYSLQRRK